MWCCWISPDHNPESDPGEWPRISGRASVSSRGTISIPPNGVYTRAVDLTRPPDNLVPAGGCWISIFAIARLIHGRSWTLLLIAGGSRAKRKLSVRPPD